MVSRFNNEGVRGLKQDLEYIKLKQEQLGLTLKYTEKQFKEAASAQLFKYLKDVIEKHTITVQRFVNDQKGCEDGLLKAIKEIHDTLQ